MIHGGRCLLAMKRLLHAYGYGCIHTPAVLSIQLKPLISSCPAAPRAAPVPVPRRRSRRRGSSYASMPRPPLAVICRSGYDGSGDDFELHQGSAFSSSSSSSPPSPYQILGVDPSCSSAQLKDAFRRKVKEFHPDISKDMKESDAMIRRVIQAYELLSKHHKSGATERACSDPFEEPECEAYELFVNEFVCIGKGCTYSCVKRAPHAFAFSAEVGTAHAISQGHGEDYLVQLAVGQCPRRCIHYVTPPQRAILEEILSSILNAPYDLAEVAFLESLIAKATFENNRYQKPKNQPKASTEFVDWY